MIPRLARCFTIRGGAVLLAATLLAHLAVMASPLHAHAMGYAPGPLAVSSPAASATAAEPGADSGHAGHQSIEPSLSDGRRSYDITLATVYRGAVFIARGGPWTMDCSGAPERGAELEAPAPHPSVAHCALSPAPAPSPPRVQAPRPSPWGPHWAGLPGTWLSGAGPVHPATLGGKPPGAAAMRAAQALLQVFRN